MNKVIQHYFKEVQFCGDIKKDVYNLLIKNNRIIIAEHTFRVASKAKELALRFQVDDRSAEIAGLLHDIGGIFLNCEKIQAAQQFNIEILPEEAEAPIILHQKISKAMAAGVFNIMDNNVLEAIGCHTTLKANATKMDMVVFIADKLEWDQKGTPPYLTQVEEQLNKSLELATFSFLKYQWENKSSLKVVHPWLEAAYRDLKERISFEYGIVK